MNVNTLTLAELWEVIDSFGPQNKIVVGDATVRITNQYHDNTYLIRTEQDLALQDRIQELDSSIYRRKHNLVFCYNEGRREHFFINPEDLKNHIINYEEWLAQKHIR